MRNIVPICCLVCASATFGMGLPRPPAAVEIDAEAATNASLGMAARELTELRVRVSLYATPTNAVTVAIGCDADGDGILAPSEEDMSFGCDCGTWFVRDAEGIVEELASAAFGRTEREWTIPMRGSTADWNLVRVTRHGSEAADESIFIDTTRRYLYLRIR